MNREPSSEPRHVPVALLGICGGVAAYKAVDLVSRLKKGGYDVHVTMSDAAQKFVTPLTFAAVSGNPVLETLFPEPSGRSGEPLYPHLYPATRADLFVLLPATADMIAKAACGLANDVVSTAMLSLPATCRRVFCPAMNVEMWNQDIVQSNVRALEARGWLRIGPETGMLACGMEGYGRMAEPADIAEKLLDAPVDPRMAHLRGRRVLILSGPTREHLDPVRYIGNPSSGKMGRALAEQAVRAGAVVHFVTGPVADDQLPRDTRIHLHRVVSAREMLERAASLYDEADVVIYAAAVADYRPVTFHDEKLPKEEGELTVRLTATPDVAATLNQGKRPGQVVIGFALQTHDGEAKAREKLARKSFDGIILNAMDALGGDSGTYRYLDAGADTFEDWGTLSKPACAVRILEAASRRVAALPARP